MKPRVVIDFLAVAVGSYQISRTILSKAVTIDWVNWDRQAKYPAALPGGDCNEPEDFILCRNHDEDAANQIGELYSVTPLIGALVELRDVATHEGTRRTMTHTVRVSTWNGADIFLGSGHSMDGSGPYCTEKFKAWIERQCGKDDAEQFFRFQLVQSLE